MWWLTGDDEYGMAGDWHLYTEGPSPDLSRLCALDLRDVTARAHAAWVYTQMDSPAGGVPCQDRELSDRWYRAHKRYKEGNAVRRVLLRMANGDESVTITEARAALDWAHLVAGDSDGAGTTSPRSRA